MRPQSKVFFIAAAYLAAFAIACIAVAFNDASMDPVTRQGGMAAFGDTVLFLGVFGVCAAAVTAYALYTFRDRTALWRVLSISAMVISGTAIVSLFTFAIVSRSEPGATMELWGGFAVMRMLMAPMFSVAFAFIGLIAPGRPAKLKFFGAAILEGATFAYAMVGLASGV